MCALTEGDFECHIALSQVPYNVGSITVVCPPLVENKKRGTKEVLDNAALAYVRSYLQPVF